MSTVRVVVVVCLVGLLAASAHAVTLKADYPLSVTTVTYPSGNQKDVVVVHYKSGAGADASANLDTFMGSIVPASLRSTGALPVPADVPTMMEFVEVPCSKSCVIFNQDNLPIWLRVRAEQVRFTDIDQDRHERFDGVLMDPWSIESYFITQFTAVCRVTKYHATRYHRVFNWVDP